MLEAFRRGHLSHHALSELHRLLPPLQPPGGGTGGSYVQDWNATIDEVQRRLDETVAKNLAARGQDEAEFLAGRCAPSLEEEALIIDALEMRLASMQQRQVRDEGGQGRLAVRD